MSVKPKMILYVKISYTDRATYAMCATTHKNKNTTHCLSWQWLCMLRQTLLSS